MFLIIPEYLLWHYGRGLRELKQIVINFLLFVYHFFSIPLLLKTLFVPWHRLGESYKKGFNPGSFFETFILNTLMRLVGAFFRLFFITAGIFLLIMTMLCGILAFLFWLVLPFVILISFIKGLLLL